MADTLNNHLVDDVKSGISLDECMSEECKLELQEPVNVIEKTNKKMYQSLMKIMSSGVDRSIKDQDVYR